ncbi:MAG: ZIP family metal transporter [Pseudomonadota bacterium]
MLGQPPFGYILLPLAVTVLGGIIAAFRAPGPKLTSAIQHFAAGVVFAAIGLELLPDLVGEHAPLEVLVGFTAGVLLMLGVKWLTEFLWPEPSGRSRVSPRARRGRTFFPIGLVATVTVDLMIDGFLIGVGFAAGAEKGKNLMIALTVELLFLGLSVSAALAQSGVGRLTSIVTTTIMAFFVVIGSVTGFSLLAGLQGPALAGSIAFGSSALLYLVTEELLVEAHKVPETPWLTAMFFAGFLLFLELGITNT